MPTDEDIIQQQICLDPHNQRPVAMAPILIVAHYQSSR